ncbi:AMP-binding protein, partial [Actinomadura kijaniata]|uniref:AMP-binding protein n=1 Tax=Actinomadura kijaniata TaxID=46161 RepID=UPI003F1DF1D3
MMTEPCVHDLVAAQPADRVALVHRDRRLTYGELNARADRLADRLAHAGVTLETPVGVLLERSPEFVVTILAILRAGGHYVPLDPAYPTGRLELMVEATGTTVIVTDADLAGRLPATGATVLTPGTGPS